MFWLEIILGMFFTIYSHILLCGLFMSGVLIAFEYVVNNNTEYLDKLIWFATSFSEVTRV